MVRLKKFKTVKAFAIFGALLGATVGFIIGTLAGGSNIGNTMQPVAFFTVMIAIYGTMLGSVLGYGLLTHVPAMPKRRSKSKKKRQQKKVGKDGWIIVDGERIDITPGTTVIVFENAS